MFQLTLLSPSESFGRHKKPRFNRMLHVSNRFGVKTRKNWFVLGFTLYIKGSSSLVSSVQTVFATVAG